MRCTGVLSRSKQFFSLGTHRDSYSKNLSLSSIAYSNITASLFLSRFQFRSLKGSSDSEINNTTETFPWLDVSKCRTGSDPSGPIWSMRTPSLVLRYYVFFSPVLSPMILILTSGPSFGLSISSWISFTFSFCNLNFAKRGCRTLPIVSLGTPNISICFRSSDHFASQFTCFISKAKSGFSFASFVSSLCRFKEKFYWLTEICVRSFSVQIPCHNFWPFHMGCYFTFLLRGMISGHPCLLYTNSPSAVRLKISMVKIILSNPILGAGT